MSNLQNVATGVPQGSCLGPLFFIIYINDIVKIISNVNIILFADDIVIYTNSNSFDGTCSTLNNNLKSIHQWSCANQLVLNPSKSKVIHFSPSPTSPAAPDVTIANSAVEVVSSIKYLGLTIQSNLKFNSHISNVINQISKGTGILYAMKAFLPSECLRKLYFAFIYPHLVFHILAWGGSRPNLLNPLAISQNKAVRNLNISTSASETYKLLNLLKFEDIYKLNLAAFMYHQINEHDIYFEFITESYINHQYATRSSQYFRIPVMRTIVNESLFLNKGLVLWNSIPDEIKESQSHSIFKKKYRNHLQSTN